MSDASPNTPFADLRKLSPKVTGGLIRMREAAYADGLLPGKHKLLTTLAISVALRCEPCLNAYARLARDRGATEPELIEFLNVAITMQGCPGEDWAAKALAAFRQPVAPEQGSPPASCCEP